MPKGHLVQTDPQLQQINSVVRLVLRFRMRTIPPDSRRAEEIWPATRQAARIGKSFVLIDYALLGFDLPFKGIWEPKVRFSRI